MRPLLLLAVLAVTAAPLPAQMAGPIAKAAETITAEDVARHLGVIAHDSMMGRDTPSRGLDLTAQYIADQFKKFGLKPAGDSGGWLQRYAISRRRLAVAQSRVVFAAGGKEAVVSFATAALLNGGTAPDQPVSGGAMLVAGPHTPESVAKLDVRDKIVLYVSPPEGPGAAARQQVEQRLLAASKWLVVLSRQDSTTFAARIQNPAAERVSFGTPRGAVIVQPNSVQAMLGAAGVDLAQARAATTPIARDLAGLTVRMELKDEVISSTTAPNTVGILEGTDPKLKDEYIVFSAHMDHIGITRGQADSINNGADDDGSGTVGIVELAEAFSRAGVRPRRSLVFLTVSGEEKGLRGSYYFSQHPPVPLTQMVANINIDMIGRNWKDTIVAIGKEHSDLGATLNRVAAAHPELRMAAIDDRWPGENFYFRSDHYNFARSGVPILFFFSGVHPDYHQVTDSPEKIDAEKEARILRLIYYLGQEVANAGQRPQWNEASYRQIVGSPAR